MATPENKVKAFIKARLQKHLEGVIIYCPPGGPFGKAGMPDFACWWQGVPFVIEAKAEGGVVSELQKRRLTEFAAQAVLAAVVRGKDEERMAEIIRRVKEKANVVRSAV